MSSDLAEDFELAMDRALGATHLGELQEAERLLRRAAQLQPASALPHFLMAANFAQAGSTDLAEAAYLMCLSRAPGLAVARFQLGLLQLTNGRVASARATWEPLLRSDGEQALRCFAQGLLEIPSENTSAGADLVRQGLALNRENPALNRDMQGVLSRLESLQAGGTALRSVPAGQGPAAPQEEEPASAAHFLISGYRQQ